ncbi:AAA family ATPase [Acinetobacter faecalis]|uniref:AAA family ATPase n=1 Tax=Acinetobacter faecalis TaxID=2665161 RepID=UPI002A9179F3|nr:AAA family ATPase [Acinetobacter faecalis]MDY6451314.1 ATP-binding protein [Acinetobacter faecalis]MDY6457403.1 ATP-binding protein [Acinetobacter faecalis]MDY6469020.1 ATP-binding protein [Acinetobacter faecalis]
MQLIIFTGVQASGKSSFYLLNLAHSHLRINLDMLKTRHRENIIFEAGLASKTKMVIDNTNPTKADRARYIQRAKDAGFEVISYYFETDLNSTLERNSHRIGKANIPEVGVRATYKKLEIPSLDEGFDKFFEVKIAGNGDFLISSKV